MVYLKSDGTVWATGMNTSGQLGDGTTTQRNNPVQVKNADGSGLSGVVGITAGQNHTVYLKSDGTVWATGSNTSGQLGDGTQSQRTNPVQVKNADDTGLSGWWELQQDKITRCIRKAMERCGRREAILGQLGTEPSRNEPILCR